MDAALRGKLQESGLRRSTTPSRWTGPAYLSVRIFPIAVRRFGGRETDARAQIDRRRGRRSSARHARKIRLACVSRGGWVDRQGVAPGLRLRRGAVGRGFGCGSGRLGINVHREPETDLCRGPWFEFPGRRHHGAGRPFVALDDPQDPARQATIASGAENAVTAVSAATGPVSCR